MALADAYKELAARIDVLEHENTILRQALKFALLSSAVPATLASRPTTRTGVAREMLQDGMTAKQIASHLGWDAKQVRQIAYRMKTSAEVVQR